MAWCGPNGAPIFLALGDRGVLALDDALKVGRSARYKGQASATAYMELLIGGAPRVGAGGGRRETHIFKANHPDDAANWLTDFQVPPALSEFLQSNFSCFIDSSARN